MKKTLLLLSLQLSLSFFASAQGIKGNYAIKNVQTGMLIRVKDAGSKMAHPWLPTIPRTGNA